MKIDNYTETTFACLKLLSLLQAQFICNENNLKNLLQHISFIPNIGILHDGFIFFNFFGEVSSLINYMKFYQINNTACLSIMIKRESLCFMRNSVGFYTILLFARGAQ